MLLAISNGHFAIISQLLTRRDDRPCHADLEKDGHTHDVTGDFKRTFCHNLPDLDRPCMRISGTECRAWLPPACSVDWPPPASVCPRGGWEEPGICCRGAGDRGVEFGELALPPGPDEKGGAWGVFDPKGSKPFENWKLPGVRFTNRRPPDVLFFAETLGASGELQCPEDFGVLFVP